MDRSEVTERLIILPTAVESEDQSGLYIGRQAQVIAVTMCIFVQRSACANETGRRQPCVTLLSLTLLPYFWLG